MAYMPVATMVAAVQLMKTIMDLQPPSAVWQVLPVLYFSRPHSPSAPQHSNSTNSLGSASFNHHHTNKRQSTLPKTSLCNVQWRLQILNRKPNLHLQFDWHWENPSFETRSYHLPHNTTIVVALSTQPSPHQQRHSTLPKMKLPQWSISGGSQKDSDHTSGRIESYILMFVTCA